MLYCNKRPWQMGLGTLENCLAHSMSHENYGATIGWIFLWKACFIQINLITQNLMSDSVKFMKIKSRDFLRTVSSIDLISLKIQFVGGNLSIFLSSFLFILIFSIKKWILILLHWDSNPRFLNKTFPPKIWILRQIDLTVL